MEFQTVRIETPEGADERNQMLEVEFSNGSVYQYTGVSREVHRRLMNAPSPGSFFDDNIAEDFSSKRV